ncbi:2-oxoglutarate-dependent dioxygenase htyE-like [Anneissia japonica]|uniref:2-oxoglutarate-dependent dioxygenase htyE-like n=1 Tax=Anneissia japonica TaxID=1529436 RepID=UPI001425A0A9|nr:2-oxoglutarate-dependent dioxygenase htyE-like [Anneissia japonica]
MSNSIIPVVDFSAYCIQRNKPDEERFQKLIEDVRAALSTIGFAYLINTGLSENKVFIGDEITMDQSDLYYRLNPTRPKDLKESLDFIPATRDQLKKTCDIITPGFIDSVCDLYDELKQINFRVLEVFGHALKLKDPMFFVKAHSRMGENDNHSTFRTLYYPPSTDVVQKEGQIRCGEHSDYGGVTLLLQDETGGLEVKGLDGKFHAATPMPGSIVINIGDMLQRWTADQLVSTVHRVVVPKGTRTNNSRQSMAFFGHPNSNQDIVCIDGSNKYPPTNSDTYMESKYSKSFDK